ncbi:hypothetical protein N8E86_09930 [Avibacterium paragallinarum]|uniref:hypothetical protein n=1 Tax=Avibacterium paragallinarum TaxID=728 RepID=UPI0021F7FC5D|nr:hypothetical protein [Avibacterium paragallinarum]UXN34359.1 hypothetical protein N8E86_09930 [Avibacterium paragallinarum]
MKVEIARDELNDLVVYAERYALGRSTYAVNDVCSFIKNHYKKLSKNTLNILIKDIQDYCDNHGEVTFREMWKEILGLLEEYAHWQPLPDEPKS